MKNRLAIFGGEPIIKNHQNLRINWPIVDSEDKKAVVEAFEEDDFCGRSSARVSKLEKIFAKQYKGYYPTALNSGTAALHLSMLSLGIRLGDEVIVPALTFIATAMSVIHNQSIPIFADIDKQTYNILPVDIEKKITKRTRAVIVVHMHGLPADIDPIIKICKKYRLKLIEDVAQAPGAIYKGKEVGNFGDASIFSLMSQKNIPTCGECGMLLNRKLADKNRAEMAKIYGEVVRRGVERAYNSFSLGWNYTLNPIQAAMATTQMEKYIPIKKLIQKNARRLNKALDKFSWVTPPSEPSDTESVFHFYRFDLDSTCLGYTKKGNFRKAIQDALNAEGLNVRHYQKTPLAGQPFFQQKDINAKTPWLLSKKNYKYNINDFPNTLSVLNSSLVLGAISSSPGYLLCPGTIDSYVKGFKKIEDNMKELLAYADRIKDPEPWKGVPVISDSYKVKYKVSSNL